MKEGLTSITGDGRTFTTIRDLDRDRITDRNLHTITVQPLHQVTIMERHHRQQIIIDHSLDTAIREWVQVEVTVSQVMVEVTDQATAEEAQVIQVEGTEDDKK